MVEKALSLPGEFMQSIMSREIAYSFRRSDFGIDRTTKSDDSLFRLPAISQFGYAADDLLFICPLSQSSFIPPENPNVWDALAFQLKETSLLKSAHTIFFALSTSSSVRDLPIRDAFRLVAGRALVINYLHSFSENGWTAHEARFSPVEGEIVRKVVSLLIENASNQFLAPQHLAPRHYRSRLTTSRHTDGERPG
jgi:hypothetical protein